MVPILRPSVVELLPDGLHVKANPHHGCVVEDPAPVKHESGLLHRRVDPSVIVPSGCCMKLSHWLVDSNHSLAHLLELVPLCADDQGVAALGGVVRVSLDGDELLDAGGIVPGDEGVLEVHEDLLPRHLGIVDGQFGALVHELLGHVDGSGLPTGYQIG